LNVIIKNIIDNIQEHAMPAPANAAPTDTADPDDEMAFYMSIGRELQKALASNDGEPMEDRVERLKGVRRAMLDVVEGSPSEAMLMSQMFATHYATMACLQGAGQAGGSVDTACRLRGNAVSMMRAYNAAMRLHLLAQAPMPARGRGVQ
jgi:hypothetical protein